MKKNDPSHNLSPTQPYLADASWTEASLHTLKGWIDTFGFFPGAGFASTKLSYALSNMQEARIKEAFHQVQEAVQKTLKLFDRQRGITQEEFIDATRRLIIRIADEHSEKKRHARTNMYIRLLTGPTNEAQSLYSEYDQFMRVTDNLSDLAFTVLIAAEQVENMGSLSHSGLTVTPGSGNSAQSDDKPPRYSEKALQLLDMLALPPQALKKALIDLEKEFLLFFPQLMWGSKMEDIPPYEMTTYARDYLSWILAKDSFPPK